MQKRKFKVPFAKTIEASHIPTEKVTLSSAKKDGALDFENTTWGKSVGGCDEEKLKTDTTTKSNLLIDRDRPSPHKVYRHQEYERVGRLSRNRAKDSKGTRYCLSLKFDVYTYPIYLVFFSVMEQIRSGEILFYANLKKQEEKRKLKKLKKEQSLLDKDRKIGSTYILFKLTLFSGICLHDRYASYASLY